jgi:circadian clock protein KaiC
MRSIGLHLQHWIESGLLRFRAARPSAYGVEMHLAMMMKEVRDHNPDNVIIDPISNIVRASEGEAHAMAVRAVDFLKTRGITALMTNPTGHAQLAGHTEVAISSIIDTWLLVQSVESGGERNRTLLILKARGMNHSNQVREFLITDNGIELVDVYTGPDGTVLTGAARAAKESQERANEVVRQRKLTKAERRLERRRHEVEAQVAALRAELEAEEANLVRIVHEAQDAEGERQQARQLMAKLRGADTPDGETRATQSPRKS